MRNKRNYLLGITITGFGDGIQQIALMWYIFHLTGEAASIGLMIAIYYLPSMLLTPFLSVYIDHHDSKNIVVATDALRFLFVFVMAVLIFFHVESAVLFYLMQFILAICYTIYKPASQSFIKESFSNQDIPLVIANSSSLSEAAALAGMAVSGVLLVNLSISASFFINSLTFLVAAILYFFIKRVRPKQWRGGKVHYIPELVAGWKFINQKAGMKFLLFLSIINSISIQMTTTLMLPLAHQFHGGSALYSSFEMAFSIGGIVSGLVVTYFLKKLKRKVILVTMAGMMISAFLLYVNDFKIAAVICIFILGLFTMAHLTIVQTLIQLNTTKEYIGRVIGLRTILASFVKMSSALLTGTLISSHGIQNILLAFVVLILLSFLTWGNMKRVEVPV